MFKRILHEHWTEIIPIISFVIMFLVFVITTIRALRIRPSQREHLASLPLDQSGAKSDQDN